MDDSKTFCEQLTIRYPTLGRALWEPDPGGLYNAVQVGDVGFIRHGYFTCLFNALSPRDRPSDYPPESDPHFPHYLRRLQPRTSNHIRASTDHRRDFRSKDVTNASREPNIGALGPDDDTQVTFSCSGRQGALLYLPFPAEREDTVAFGDFGKWILQNIYNCMRLAEERGLGVNRMEDIILVTGRHLARSWVRTVFSENRGGAEVSFVAQVSGNSVVHLEERSVSGARLEFGPNGENLPKNQCIFVRGYHVSRILNIWPRLRGLAGPAPDLHEPEPESDTHLQLMGVPADTDDPLHTLLEYIAEKDPSCDVVLVHDDDLKCIENAIPPLETLQPDTLMGSLRELAPKTRQFQCESFSGNENESEAEITVATLATLSLNLFGGLHDEGTISSSISTSKTTLSGYERPTKELDNVPTPSTTTATPSPVVPSFTPSPSEPSSLASPQAETGLALQAMDTFGPRAESGDADWQIDGQFGGSSVQASQMKSSNSSGGMTLIPNNFSPPPSSRLPHWGGRTPTTRKLQTERSKSEGTFQDSPWAFRPSPEEVLDRLEAFFPDHDLDKPAIEASSGETTPTAAENPPAPPPHKGKPPADKQARHKKSIRVVAEEHNARQHRTSRLQSSSAANVIEKRIANLWDSWVEEATPGHITSGMPPIPDSPSASGPGIPTLKPIFKWVRGGLIGKGNFGRVYIALNATTGEMIAVRQLEISRTGTDKDDSPQVTVVEALNLERLTGLDHPNIVRYLGFEEISNVLSIFMEYVPGGSIGSCLRKYGPFEENVTKYFTEQILSGLEYLHSRRILHRDLKADNILVEKTGVCKISDFGISKQADNINEQDVLTAMHGTVYWMAPEVVNTGNSSYNSKADIWSVGCVVLEMWAGERPWRKYDAMAVIKKLHSSKQAPPIPSSVIFSPQADEFRKKCFAMDPNERPSAAELQKHPYLNRPPGWVFCDFSGSQEVARYSDGSESGDD